MSSSSPPKKRRLEEEAAETVNVLDQTLTCTVCHERLVLPVKILFPCNSCSMRCCLMCAKSYLMLDKPFSERKRSGTGQTVKCLLCDQRVDVASGKPNDERLMEQDVFLMKVLDAIYEGEIVLCPYCKSYEAKSQGELLRHVSDSCPMAHTTCSWCKNPVKRESLLQHVSTCPAAEKCSWCHHVITAKQHRPAHISRCPKRRVRCIVCEQTIRITDIAEHLKGHNEDILASATLVVPPGPKEEETIILTPRPRIYISTNRSAGNDEDDEDS